MEWETLEEASQNPTVMDSDLDIARAATIEPIEEIAWKLSIPIEDIMHFGSGIAKIKWSAIKARLDKPQGNLILVTSVNPTPFGEGKTVTTIGLSQALNRYGAKAVCAIREPSMGPVFGIKGGAAGGGFSQVLPMEEINLHFTGDLHAVTSAHNLLSTLLDNHIKHGNDLKIDSLRLTWPRVIDLNDRALRNVTVGKGGAANGYVREDRFDITAASEVMAILVLASDYKDLRNRLGDIVVGQDTAGNPVRAEQLEAAGSMALLLRQAFLPNLVQTLEKDPAFIHGGPFANIAHGNSSIIADRLALSCADYVVTEAGFGSDMGAEKFMHIKAATSGRAPDCIVMNVTIRSMKLHGGAFGDIGGRRQTSEEMAQENIEAVKTGAKTNLDRHVRNMLRFGVPVVVSINKFHSDTQAEIDALRLVALESGARDAVVFDGHARGGIGGLELAKAVIGASEEHIAAGRPFTPLFENDTPLAEKALKVVTHIYGGAGINIHSKAHRQLTQISKWGYGNLPICMAKSQYSFSHDPNLLGAPSGFEVPIKEFRLNAGAGFVVAVLGDIMTMPGLPKRPAAADMDMDENGNLTGMFS